MALLNLEDFPDVSFINDIDLDKIESKMISDYQDKYTELTGKTAHLERGEPISLLAYAVAVQLFQIYLDIDKAGKENLLKYSEGNFLDNIAALKGISRSPARSATVTMRFTLSAPQNTVIAIPKGTRVTDDYSTVYFATEAYAEIPIGETTADVDCEALTAGKGSNGFLKGTINVLVDPIPYVRTVENINESAGGTDIEEDDSLKERIYIAPSRHSTTGTLDAYRYWVETYSQDITDVLITSKTPGEVDISFLENGDIPEDAAVKGLQNFITDLDIKTLTDNIVVSAPAVQTYNINLTYYINRSDSNKVATIQSNVSTAIDEYITWQQSKIGRDINPSELIRRVMAAGAKRVEVTDPVFTKTEDISIAKNDTKTVIYGGLEND